MASTTLSMSLNDLLSETDVMSKNIKENESKISRYGIDVAVFTSEMESDRLLAASLNQEQERLKSLLKNKTEELKTVQLRLEKNYALARKTVKMAEPQINWVAYGIKDKR